MHNDIRRGLLLSLGTGALPKTLIYVVTFITAISELVRPFIFNSVVIATLVMYITGGIGLGGLWVLGIYGLKKSRNLSETWIGWKIALLIGVAYSLYIIVATFPWSYPQITLPIAIGPLIPAFHIAVLLNRPGAGAGVNKDASR